MGYYDDAMAKQAASAAKPPEEVSQLNTEEVDSAADAGYTDDHGN